jgi:hypothetical protein
MGEKIMNKKTGTIMNRFIITILLFASCLFYLFPQDFDQYLLMKPIEKAIISGDFSGFKAISKEKISVNLEAPFDLNGYLYMDKFIEDFNRKFSHFETKRNEWSSIQLEEEYAVQSLNLILMDKRSEKNVYYKFIFFLTKEIKKTKQEWKIYYLRGLKI